MRRFDCSLRPYVIGLAAAAGLMCSPPSHAVVISQIYGGGGNSHAAFSNDFIELFNNSASSLDLGGWSVQYTSASGSSWQTTVLAGLIAPYGYFLIAEDAGSSGDGSPLPAADLSGSINLSAGSGKVALVDGADALSGGCPGSALLDLVGYGTANCYEGGAAAGTLSSTLAALRLSGGLTDTDDNISDFRVGAPSPRNSASPANAPLRSDPDPDPPALPEPPTGLLALPGLLALLLQQRSSARRATTRRLGA